MMMAGREPQGAADPQPVDWQPEQTPPDSLAWWLRSIYRCRWLCLLVLIIGGLAGIFSAWNAPRFQTTALLRLSSEALGYQQTVYWQGRGNTVAAQLRAWGHAADGRGSLVVRPESTPWLLRIEILHPEPGGGTRLIERLLNVLRTVQAESDRADGLEFPRQTRGQELQSLLNRFQQLLFKLQREAGLPPGLTESPVVPVPQPAQNGPTDMQLPYSLVPHVQRYQSLMLSADQYFSSVVSESVDVPSGPEQLQLLEMQHLLAQKLLAFRGSLDLMRVALESETAVLDEIEEQQLPFLKVLSQSLILAGAGGVCLALLLAASWAMVADHWYLIRNPHGMQRL